MQALWGLYFRILILLACFGPIFPCHTRVRGLSNKDILQSDDAENAISTTKFPLRGKRLLTAAITQFEFQGDGTKEEIKQLGSVKYLFWLKLSSVLIILM